MNSFQKAKNRYFALDEPGMQLRLAIFRCLALFSAILVLTSLMSNAQKASPRFATTSDVAIDSSKRKVVSKSCNRIENYIPDANHPEFTPLRTVRINFHVIQDGNGENNFSEVEGRAFIKKLLENANARLTENHKMNLPKDNTTPVIRIPYRYVLTGRPGDPKDDGIYFHRDDSLYSMNKKSKKKDNVYDRRQYNTYGIQKDTVINIFLLEHNKDSLKSPGYKASNDGVGPGPFAKLVGSYYLWKNPNVLPNGDTLRFTAWNLSGLMNHELGHCFGLAHTWSGDDGCDDTPNHPGCWNYGPPPCEICSNNMMDYNAYQNAVTPCQIGKMCMNFYSDRGARKFIVADWCNYDQKKSITIQSGEQVEWSGSMDLFGDLIIEDNASLTVHCTLSMPPGSKIIMNPKASLVLDGCTITSRCAEPWQGIEIIAGKKSVPSIVLKNGSTLENLQHPL